MGEFILNKYGAFLGGYRILRNLKDCECTKGHRNVHLKMFNLCNVNFLLTRGQNYVLTIISTKKNQFV